MAKTLIKKSLIFLIKSVDSMRIKCYINGASHEKRSKKY